jgi:hypothetical protein
MLQELKLNNEADVRAVVIDLKVWNWVSWIY